MKPNTKKEMQSTELIPSIPLLTIDWVPGGDVRARWPLRLPSSLYLPLLFIPTFLPPALSLALSPSHPPPSPLPPCPPPSPFTSLGPLPPFVSTTTRYLYNHPAQIVHNLSLIAIGFFIPIKK